MDRELSPSGPFHWVRNSPGGARYCCTEIKSGGRRGRCQTIQRRRLFILQRKEGKKKRKKVDFLLLLFERARPVPTMAADAATADATTTAMTTIMDGSMTDDIMSARIMIQLSPVVQPC